MAGTPSGGRSPQNPQNGKTRPFTTVNRGNANLAREKQRRQYEQQKKEKIIFALFVVIIIVLILIAILVFKRAIDRGEANDTDAQTQLSDVTDTGTPETTEPEPSANFLREMRDKNEIHKGELVFVDQTHSIAVPGDLADIYPGRTKFQKGSKTVYSYYLADTTPKLAQVALDALNKMADDFYTATGNNDLYVNRAYDASATNDHASGLVADLSIYTIENKLFLLDDNQFASVFNWVFSNYYKYGFIMVSPANSGERYYHFRYVGAPAATYMFKNNLGLSDFLASLRDEHAFKNNATNALSVLTDDGASYEMYYVAASDGDMTSIPIPESALHCSISGDNMGGFIVTVRMG
jgi:hypothetical protein